MTRLGANRDVHLSEREIAEVALRLFDEGPDEPSLRGLAAALNVAPATLYHHVPSLAATFQMAVKLVWAEAADNMRELMPEPQRSDPAEVLVAAALSLRRACLAHCRVARYLAATPESNPLMDAVIALMAQLLERLGLQGEEGARAMHSFSSFTLGAILFAAARKAANDALLAGSAEGRFSTGRRTPGAARTTREAIDRVMDVSIVDPARDEELFVEGLRRLIRSLVD